MRKADIITAITSFGAHLVWEIDQSEFYGFIGHNKRSGDDSTYWLKYNLEKSSLGTLKKLHKNLVDIK